MLGGQSVCRLECVPTMSARRIINYVLNILGSFKPNFVSPRRLGGSDRVEYSPCHHCQAMVIYDDFL